MSNRLFQESIHQYASSQVSTSVQKAHSIDESDLDRATLEELTERNVGQQSFVVATLRSSERRGKRRKEERQLDGFGGRVVEVSLVDVTIPFDGWPRSFSIAPSSCTVISVPAFCSQAGLQATFYDDAKLDDNVNVFMRQVTENLERLRREISNVRPQQLEAVKAVLTTRMKTRDDRKALDATRSFPID